jgi:WD40 repeat protein
MNQIPSPLSLRSIRVLPFALLALAASSRMQADLYVTRDFDGLNRLRTSVLRFDESMGLFLNLQSAPVAEGYLGVETGPQGNVFAVDNTLGYISVHRFSSQLVYQEEFGPSPRTLFFEYAGVTLDPHGNVLLASMFTPGLGAQQPGVRGIFQLDGTTGHLVSTTPFAAAPGMDHAFDLQYGPNGNLFVSDRLLGVLEFDGSTGAFLRTVVATTPGGLQDPTGISLRSNGELLVASASDHSVRRYDSAGSLLGYFIAPGSGELLKPADIDLGPDGNLYVANQGTSTVLRYRGSDGAALGEFTHGGSSLFGLGGPRFLSFSSDVPETSLGGPLVAVSGLAALWRIITCRLKRAGD